MVAMSKIDPNLLASLEQSEESPSSAEREVSVLVALRASADEAIEEDLSRRGLQVRSRLGDILTGTVRLKDVRELAAASCVVKIEASAPLYPERPGGESGEQ